MKKNLIPLVSSLCICAFTHAQIVSVNTGGSTGHGSSIREVKSTTSGERDIASSAVVKAMPGTNSMVKKIRLGPNPNNGLFWFSVSGLEKETIATLFYIHGKQIRQFKVVNLRQQKVTDLISGVYFLHIPGFEAQKIIVNAKSTPDRNKSKILISP